MVNPQPVGRMSYAEYLDFEESSAVKHEYLRGEVRARHSGTPEHARITARVGHLITAGLGDRPCEAFSSDAKVRVEETDLTTYPDVSVVYGRLERSPTDREAVVNPVVLVEVLSDSTEAYDRGEKFAHFRRIASLREYVLVSQREPRIEVFRRTGEGRWELHEATAGASVSLESIGVELAVSEVYANALAS